MTELLLSDLLANPLVDPEAHLDWERVASYELELEHLPPVVVFESNEGLLLADGYHRLAAARRRGVTTIRAEIRLGTRGDALRYAAEVGARQRGIPVEHALAAITAVTGGGDPHIRSSAKSRPMPENRLHKRLLGR